MTPVEAVSFDASAQGCTALEDVLTLINEKSDAHDRLIVVFDEFQEIANLDPGTDSRHAVAQKSQLLVPGKRRKHDDGHL